MRFVCIMRNKRIRSMCIFVHYCAPRRIDGENIRDKKKPLLLLIIVTS